MIHRLTPLAALALMACGVADPSETAAPAPATMATAPAYAGPAMSVDAIESATFTALPTASATATGKATDAQKTSGDPTTPKMAATPEPSVIRAQILLDRARFSPGVIDGLGGENTRQAIAAFEKANSLTVDGQLDEEVFDRLTTGDGNRVLQQYTVTAEDVAGPFIDVVPEEPEAKAQLKSLAYTSVREALAEKFHMDEDLVSSLNPSGNFAAGQVITVALVSPTKLPTDVARIEVNKADSAVRVYSADGKLLAFYPATIGSSERPTPEGSMTVTAVAPRPNYTYDPSRLTFAKGDKVLTIPAGPNNPVGSVWIDLSKDTYGIHGTPDPSEIGKTASSGCVRLTNWDAQQLAASVKAGVAVVFT